ncbi:hypothetical protein QQ054_01115 [Oscillatoria amoena NRMC-F 0135]|nr:hypothetical protein [Oscillatoria amoena NRMC-F 0135]
MPFTKLNPVVTVKSKYVPDVIRIYKYKKDGTKRFFFNPELNGKRLTNTMFVRLWEAEDVSKKTLEGIRKGTIVAK